MIDKIKKSISAKEILFFFVPFALFALGFVVQFSNMSLDSFWMYNEGSKPGVVRDYICQQWAFNKIVYFMYNIIPFTRMQVVITICTTICVILFLIKSKWNIFSKLYFLAFFFINFYGAFSVRPWVINIVCDIVVYYVSDFRNKRYEFWERCVIMFMCALIVANFECATLPFLFCFIGVRLFDAVLQRDWNTSLKVLVFEIVTFIGSLINPYGIDGLMYMPNSLLKGTFVNVPIGEMRSISYSNNNLYMAIIVALSLFIVWLTREETTIGEKICSVVCCILTCIAIRNVIYMGIANIVIVYRYIKKNDRTIRNFVNLKKKEQIFSNCLKLFIGASVGYCILANIISPDYGMPNYPKCTVSDRVIEIVNELDPNQDKKVFIYPNVAGYFEMNGYENVYMDTRPELIPEEQQKDLLKTYNNKEVPEFFDKYDFEVVVVNKDNNEKSNMNIIIGYLTESDAYEVLYEDQNTYVIIKEGNNNG